MGLDVYIMRDGANLRWGDPVMDLFPFKPAWDTFEEDSKEITVGFIPGIVGMDFSPEETVSFRGRGYSSFAKYIRLPYSFYDNLTTEQIKEQYIALALYLQQFEGMPGNTVIPPESPNVPYLEEVLKNGSGFLFTSEVDTLENITNLCTLLKWVAENNLTLYADY